MPHLNDLQSGCGLRAARRYWAVPSDGLLNPEESREQDSVDAPVHPQLQTQEGRPDHGSLAETLPSAPASCLESVARTPNPAAMSLPSQSHQMARAGRQVHLVDRYGSET